MKRPKIIFLIGLWIALLPFLGFPSSWKTLFFALTGIGLMYLGYKTYGEYHSQKEKVFENFSENLEFDDARQESIPG